MTSWWHRLFDVSSAWHATGWYIVLTLAMTWPLALGLTRDIPGDLGDPVFACWVIARSADHWLALLSGDVSVATRFWHAEMFHPEPWVTLFSEHFAAHALQILPIWLLTKNIILCYNLLLLSSFVLSGVGMYFLARELTGSSRGAFVAGLLFMLAPYRFVTLSHLQVMSAQWMPLALFGLRRYFTTGGRWALAGGAGAIALQNLSSGYYLIYFGPVVGLYALSEMWARGLIRRWQTWRDLAIAAAAALAMTLPFSLPYAMLQRRIGYRRDLNEVRSYSADILSWLTASPFSSFWAWAQALPRPEGFLFPGLTIVIVAVAGMVVVARQRNDVMPPSTSGSPTASVAFAVLAGVFASWMAMGPTPSYAGHPLPVPSLYMWFYEHVPGYDVSRVPARFMTIILLALAIPAAFATAWLDRSRWRAGLALVAAGALIDGAALPLRRNAPIPTSTKVQLAPTRIYPESDAPPLWRRLRALPRSAVIAHLPFGYVEHELQFLYYSRIDGHRLSNGYSGGFPLSYQERATILQRAVEAPVEAVARLRADGVTHVVLHSELYVGDEGLRTVAALERAGMRLLWQLDAAFVFEVPC